MDKVTFSDKGIQFENYPVTPASIFPDDIILWNEIREADPDCWPPELRLHTGEILFVSAEKKEAFAVACLRHNIPLIRRHDVWADLLEPFLDTEFTKDDQQRTIERLVQSGFSENEIQQIRNRVEKTMLTYNYFAWEWMFFGLFDLFTAYGLTTNRRLRWIKSHWRPTAKKKIYGWAMDIANRGRQL
jgi:hypothetical protein